MKSSLNLSEFKSRLTELTSEENGFYFITPYNWSGTPFCGTYDERTFELTKNSFWTHVKAIVVRGEYKQLDDYSTDVTYEIGWTKFMKRFFVAFNIAALVGINAFILVNRDRLEIPVLTMLVTLNGVLVFGNLLCLAVNWVTRTIVDQRFRDEFKIGVEDEWEKLAKSIVNEPPSS